MFCIANKVHDTQCIVVGFAGLNLHQLPGAK